MVDATLPKYPCLQARLEFMARLRQAGAAAEDTRTFLLEILKFLGTLALILATALIMLMAG
jgi:hypothetical protein